MSNDEDKQKSKEPKDRWDILQILVTLLVTTIGGGIGGVTTTVLDYHFREQEVRRQRVETVEKFMPYLIGEKGGANFESAQQNTIIVIAALGDEDLAINLAKFNPNPASLATLRDIALGTTDKTRAFKAVNSIGEIGKNTPKLFDIAQLALTSMIIKEDTQPTKASPLLQEVSEKATNVLATLYSQPSLTISNLELPVFTLPKFPVTQPPPPNSVLFQEWGIVIGSDTDLEGAKHEKQQAKLRDSQNKKQIEIFQRQGWYATVITNINDNDKDRILKDSQDNFRQGSFLIDFKKWCGTNEPTKKTSQDNIKYYECK